MNYIDKENVQRQAIAQYYIREINNDKLVLPKSSNDKANQVWHLFVVRTQKREDLQKYLLENGIQTLIHYPIPPHLQKAFSSWKFLKYPIFIQEPVIYFSGSE